MEWSMKGKSTFLSAIVKQKILSGRVTSFVVTFWQVVNAWNTFIIVQHALPWAHNKLFYKLVNRRAQIQLMGTPPHKVDHDQM